MPDLQEYQYKDSSKYNARIKLHYKFGINKYPWPLWVFDNIIKAENLKVLEIGCGNGLLWKLNANRIPYNWKITLSDFSQGMLNDAMNNIAESLSNITYEVINAEYIPYENNIFDIIIANHMLYHIPNRIKSLSEIHRVLKNNGIFYATTMRSSYMKELRDIIINFKSKSYDEYKTNRVINNFSIENGKEQLQDFFNEVELKLYENLLLINEAEPFANYAYSLNGINQGKELLNESDRDGFIDYLINIIKSDGNIKIPSDSGLFISHKMYSDSIHLTVT